MEKKSKQDNLNYITRIKLSFLTMIVMVLICSGITIYLTNSIAGRTTTLYDRPHTNLLSMWEIKAKISETGSAVMRSLYNGEKVSGQAQENIDNMAGIIDTLEKNKVDKNSPRTEAMQKIIDIESVWRGKTQNIVDMINEGRGGELTPEMLAEYTELEKSFVDSIDGIIVTAQGNALKFRNESVSIAKTSIGVLCFIFLVVILAAVFNIEELVRRFRQPMKIVRDAAVKMAEGNLGERAQYERRDEFGSLIDSFSSMQIYLQKIVKEIERAVTEMGEGNFAVQISEEFVGDFAPIEGALRTITTNLSGLENPCRLRTGVRGSSAAGGQFPGNYGRVCQPVLGGGSASRHDQGGGGNCPGYRRKGYGRL